MDVPIFTRKDRHEKKFFFNFDHQTLYLCLVIIPWHSGLGEVQIKLDHTGEFLKIV